MSHYTVSEIRSMSELQQLFPEGRADALNWCLLSTSGIHGSYRKLDDWTPDSPWVTVLVIAPRMVRVRYGELEIAPEEIDWLRGLVNSSLLEIALSQRGNLPEPDFVVPG